jgi:hypothetical protein
VESNQPTFITDAVSQRCEHTLVPRKDQFMSGRNLEKVRAAVRLAMTAARLGQSFGWWRIRELPAIEEVIAILGAILDEFEETPATT